MSSEPPTSLAFIVTGASRGIGQAIVEELMRRGARVLGVARNIQASAAPSEVSSSASYYMQADVTVEADRTRIIETAMRLFGRLDGVINNAGSCSGVGDLSRGIPIAVGDQSSGSIRSS